MFVSGDNLRKGAALNAVQIAEALIEREAVRWLTSSYGALSDKRRSGALTGTRPAPPR